MTHKCEICGKEFHEWDMRGLNVGRRTKWLCRECYKSGSKDADTIAQIRGERRKKIYEKTNNRK